VKNTRNGGVLVRKEDGKSDMPGGGLVIPGDRAKCNL
jgi:hypothetical protein